MQCSTLGAMIMCGAGVGGSSQSTSRLGLVMAREFLRLHTSLLDGIYVSKRQTLHEWRWEVIICSIWVPYADVSFLFDVSVGCNYPLEPLHVVFWSQRCRENPNL